MIDRIARYEVSFFAPGTGVEATTELMMKLLDTYKDKGLLPTTVQEVTIGAPSRTRRQLCMIDNFSAWKLSFEPHRVLLIKENVHGIDMGTPDIFIEEALDIFSRLLSIIPFKGTRLSFVTKAFLAEMTVDELKKVNTNLLKLPIFYLDNPPHQWVTKIVTRRELDLGNKRELTNIITEISRLQGTFDDDNTSIPFDRIAINFDINTYQKNEVPRFDIGDFDNFLMKALETSQEITSEAEEIIYG